MSLQTSYYILFLTTSQNTPKPVSVPCNFKPSSATLALALCLSGSLEVFS